MKIRIGHVLLCTSLIFCLMSACTTRELSPVSIIPKPESLVQGNGQIRLTDRYSIYLSDPDLLSANAVFLADRIKKAVGFDLEIGSREKRRSIRLEIDPSIQDSLGSEGYSLTVSGQTVSIKGSSPAGIFYGIQTLFQLLPPAIYSEKPVTGITWSIPRVTVSDAPRFAWRGFLLDVSRHFFPVSYVREVLDHMAIHKLNRLHLHLTDDQGWRVEIRKYPKLTEVGAWRVNREDRHWNDREAQKPGEIADYGGFYSQDEIRELVKYASDRCITIVPEIEMPAHATGALASYPEFSCREEPLYVLPGGIWPCDNIFCAGKDETFTFLQDVLREVMELFPSEYIHIGGDEADKTQWTLCPACQKRIRTEGLQDEKELQSYFIRRMERFLNDNGRKLIGWDEILEGGLAPNAAVMSWRGVQGGIESARSGHKVVMTPTSHCYIDYYQGAPEMEPIAIGGYVPLEKVYSFEPVPEALNQEEARLILGAQANLWTEYVATSEHADYMAYPRLAAMSEVCWTPASLKDYTDFTTRLARHLERYSFLEINFAKSFANVSVTTKRNPETGQFEITLDTKFPGASIHYTTDGSEPEVKSNLYTVPFVIDRTTTIKAAAYADKNKISNTSVKTLLVHLASGKPVTYVNPYADSYTGGGHEALVDGIRGSINYADGSWQGFNGLDLITVIDLGTVQSIRKITLGALQAIGSWIFFPTEVLFFYSPDIQSFSLLGKSVNTISTNDPERRIQDLLLSFDPVQARYVRIEAKNLGICPAGHSGAGNPCWLFADEIIVE